MAHLAILLLLLESLFIKKKKFNIYDGNVIEIECPFYEKSVDSFMSVEEYYVDELEKIILKNNPDTIGAFIAEPIMGAGGVIIPPPKYFIKVKEVLSKYNILLLFDEVICGFERTGAWFGFEHFGTTPDMLSLAKGLTSGYFPLSATAVSSKISNALLDFSVNNGIFPHGYTYSGHPTGCAVALKNLEIIDKENLVENSRIMGDYLLSSLKKNLICNPLIKNIRGRGLLIGVQFNSKCHSNFHKTISLACKKKGLLVRPLPWLKVNAFSPPLTLNTEEVEKVCQIYTDVVNEETKDGY